MEPELIADYQNVIGEGPLWHPTEKRLYWIDIMMGRIFRFDPDSGHHEQFFQGPPLGGFTFQQDGTLLLFMAKGAVAVLRDGELSYIIEELPGESEHRFNDIIADPAGRVFCGTMSTDSGRAVTGEVMGRLYRLDTDGATTIVADDVALSNGLGFTADRKQMYHTDSAANKIYIYDYDEATGAISNRRVFAEHPDDGGVADGMTVDAEGHVWSASAGGSNLYRYTPDGVQEQSIRFPAKMVSSIAFGGANMDEMYVTTIGGENKAEQGPGAGALFRLKLGIRGVPDFYSRVGL